MKNLELLEWSKIVNSGPQVLSFSGQGFFVVWSWELALAAVVYINHLPW